MTDCDVLATGVVMRTDDEQPALEFSRSEHPLVQRWEDQRAAARASGSPLVYAQAFVEVRAGGAVERWESGTSGQSIGSEGDPTSELIGLARAMHDHLGDVVGDLRSAGYDVTRWEVYAAPYRVELSAELARLLDHRWKDRPPRTSA